MFTVYTGADLHCSVAVIIFPKVNISYINKIFINLSVSYADSSLYQREPGLQFVWVVDL